MASSEPGLTRAIAVSSAKDITDRMNSEKLKGLFSKESRKPGGWEEEERRCRHDFIQRGLPTSLLDKINPQARSKEKYVTRFDALLQGVGLKDTDPRFKLARDIMKRLIVAHRPDVVLWTLQEVYGQFQDYKDPTQLAEDLKSGKAKLPKNFGSVILGAFDDYEWVGDTEQLQHKQTPLFPIVKEVVAAIGQQPAQAETIDVSASKLLARDLGQKNDLPRNVLSGLSFESSLAPTLDSEGILDHLHTIIGSEKEQQFLSEIENIATKAQKRRLSLTEATRFFTDNQELLNTWVDRLNADNPQRSRLLWLADYLHIKGKEGKNLDKQEFRDLSLGFLDTTLRSFHERGKRIASLPPTEQERQLVLRFLQLLPSAAYDSRIVRKLGHVSINDREAFVTQTIIRFDLALFGVTPTAENIQIAESLLPVFNSEVASPFRAELQHSAHNILATFREMGFDLVNGRIVKKTKTTTEPATASSAFATDPTPTVPSVERVAKEKQKTRESFLREGFPEDLINYALEQENFPDFLNGLKEFNFPNGILKKKIGKMKLSERSNYLFSKNPFLTSINSLQETRPELYTSLSKYVLERIRKNAGEIFMIEIGYHLFESQLLPREVNPDTNKDIIGTQIDLLTAFVNRRKSRARAIKDSVISDIYDRHLNFSSEKGEIYGARNFSYFIFEREGGRLRPEAVEALNSRPEFLRRIASADSGNKNQLFFADLRIALTNEKSGVKIVSKTGGGYELVKSVSAGIQDVLESAGVNGAHVNLSEQNIDLKYKKIAEIPDLVFKLKEMRRRYDFNERGDEARDTREKIIKLETIFLAEILGIDLHEMSTDKRTVIFNEILSQKEIYDRLVEHFVDYETYSGNKILKEGEEIDKLLRHLGRKNYTVNNAVSLFKEHERKLLILGKNQQI